MLPSIVLTNNAHYGATGWAALRALFQNSFKFNARSTRSEYGWTVPLFLLYYGLFVVLFGGWLSPLYPLLVMRWLIAVPLAALTARRYQDVGVPWWIGAAQSFGQACLWFSFLNPPAAPWSERLLITTMAAGAASWLVMHVILLLPTGAADALPNTDELRAYQQAHGLTRADLKLFQTVMGGAKAQIIRWDQAAQTAPALATVSATGLNAAKALFQALMQDPQALTQYDEFLYTTLPNAVEAAERYVTIATTQVDTPEIQVSLAAIATTITPLASAITDDYERLVQDDTEALANTKLPE